MKIIYGPVDSWRLGRSLGVDILCTEGRICSFDCSYCQISKVGSVTSERKVFVETEEVERQLEEALEKVGEYTDYVTLSGMGEPTLAKNLPDVVDSLYEVTDKPKAILTNGSFFSLKEVRDALHGLDYVIAELDAATDGTFKKINRPSRGIELDEILYGYMRFSEDHEGKFALEMMFTEENKDEAEEMADIAEELDVDEIQLNTPLRPCPEDPLSEEEMEKIEDEFKNINTINVYKAKRKRTKTLDDKEIIKRGRPRKGGEY